MVFLVTYDSIYEILDFSLPIILVYMISEREVFQSLQPIPSLTGDLLQAIALLSGEIWSHGVVKSKMWWRGVA